MTTPENPSGPDGGWTRRAVKVFEVMQNTDMDEGRGQPVVFARFLNRVDAERVAPGMGVFGSDAEIRTSTYIVFANGLGAEEWFKQASPLVVCASAAEWAIDHRGSRRADEILADSDPLYRQYLELKEKFDG